MSTTHILILSCSAILLLVLGIVVYLKNKTNAINRVFALLVLFVLFWMTSNFFADFARQIDSVLLWNQLALIGGMSWGTALLYFFLVFPTQTKSKILYFLFLVYLLVALGLVFF
ncbi:MAG: hypothetical protein M1338_01520 [Patescibacteria group bacterium]|nr:hypothetical protein [Patescibacteria group bacterium]